MNIQDTQARKQTVRSPSACLACRSRHLKCDGQRPICGRCNEREKECHYAISRRGGLDRAALARRRTRLQHEIRLATTQDSSPIRPSLVAINDEPAFQLTGLEVSTATVLSPPVSVQCDNIEHDTLFTAYYAYFHKLHPFVLPQKQFAILGQLTMYDTSTHALILAMRFMGHIYSQNSWSTSLQVALVEALAQQAGPNPVIVQCRLIYSIALFWNNQLDAARREIHAAADAARTLGMFEQSFATQNAHDAPVLAESWRRTWWMLYIVDAYYAGTLGTMNFCVLDIEATVDLPCEEDEYESGDIPTPRTLDELEAQEYEGSESSFSSFAYLISAVRCAALAISITPKLVTRKNSNQLIQEADTIIDEWSLLLPKAGKEVMDKAGDIDELMFQAHLLINVVTIGLHRPLSDLKFVSIEDISSCARKPPPDTPSPDLINVHTVRVLRSVDAQIRLLALPMETFHHTPFITCMTSEGTLALLSACRHLLTGSALAIARSQIRMTIARLSIIGKTWARTARNVQELRSIARYVMGVSTGDGPSRRTISASSSERATASNSDIVTPPDPGDDTFSTEVFDTICGLQDFGDPESDFWWLTDPTGCR